MGNTKDIEFYTRYYTGQNVGGCFIAASVIQEIFCRGCAFTK